MAFTARNKPVDEKLLTLLENAGIQGLRELVNDIHGRDSRVDTMIESHLQRNDPSSQRDRLANFADEVVDAFAECHCAAAAEMEVDYPFEYALQVCVRRSGINHIWHRAIFYGDRKSPKRVDYHEISQNRFAEIPDWERLVYERVINSLNSLYKHQAQLLKLIQRYRALQASLRQF